MKKLTIVTICYNELNLEVTCKSIVNQTWQDFEWIVVDGGSNDAVQKIWNKYKYRIDKFISEPDSGRYNAMNKGIALASGEYLNFLNAGDYYFHDNVLKDIFVNNDYNGDVLYGNECFKGKDVSKSGVQLLPEEITREFLFASTIRHQASFIKKDLFDKYGLYNEAYKIASDCEKWLEFFTNNVKFEYLPYIVTFFDTNGVSFDKKSRKITFHERAAIAKKYFSEEEVKKISKKYHQKRKNSWGEQIFSLRNAPGGVYKIITILGMRIKIKR